MFNKFNLFLASILVMNLINLPVQSQSRCPYRNYMIGPDNTCIDLDGLSGRNAQKKTNQTPSADNNDVRENSTTSPEESEKSIEQIELEYAIKEKQNSLAFIQQNNEKMKQQIEISCAKLSTLNQRQFCLQERNRLGKQIEENEERMSSLDKEIKELQEKVENLANNTEN